MNVSTTNDKIHISVSLPVSQQQAWSLLTENQHIMIWWGNHVDLQTKSGGKFVEEWSDGERHVTTSGEITRFEPPELLEMTWADDDWPGETKVSFHLSGDEDGTRLVLIHSEWDVHPKDKRQDILTAHATGWSTHIENLMDYTADYEEQ